ncbi:hypothetical protein RL72_01143 [Microbacterium azadirachtae]|uniref:Uncharacterized protein n=1 Tax=Microbacterium azadirachtae TaxID=582680 RepID=A0A0F0KZB4_9MICO|nr:hypothetical protein [Microbacterium azadirachtae]KJL26208.1 hypothetical protein RL72_01143 [Microbacterium azadirachtae]
MSERIDGAVSPSYSQLDTAVILWATYLHLGGRTLSLTMIVDAWIDALKAAGFPKARKAWEGYGSSTRTLPLVIDIPCPFEHRTPDRRNFAHVRMIVEDTAWLSVDPDSPCEYCTPDVIERLLLTCPRCEADENSPRHRPGHGLRHSFDPRLGVVGSTAPISFVLDAFLRLQVEAEATAWLQAPDAALAWWVQVNDDTLLTASEVLAERREWARGILGAAPRKVVASSGAAAMTEDEAVTWLDKNEIPPTASQREAWRLSAGLPGRPAKNTIEAAQTRRKRGATEA